MSIDATTGQDYQTIAPPEWDPPEPPTDLIFDDGVPLESNRHRIAMNVLIDSALTALQEKPDSFVGGNMFVYYSRNQAMNRDFRGPDFFVVLDVDGNRERKGWVTWEEEGRYPDVIVELMSPSTADVDLNEKKLLYARTFHTTEYYVYNPFEPDSLAGWRLNTRLDYDAIAPNQQGWLWCERLNLWLGTWDGQIRREPASGTCSWLRFYDPNGNLILLQEEIAQQEHQRAENERQRAEDERQRAERLAARLRELGEDPDRL